MTSNKKPQWMRDEIIRSRRRLLYARLAVWAVVVAAVAVNVGAGAALIAAGVLAAAWQAKGGQ